MTEKTVRPRSVLRRTMLVGTAGVLGGAVLRPTPVQSQTGTAPAAAVPGSAPGARYGDPAWWAQRKEEILEPALEIIDPHHHLWDRPTEILKKIKRARTPGTGFNAETGKVQNLGTMGVLDPVATVTHAIQLAFSHARMLLETGAWGSNVPQPQSQLVEDDGFSDSMTEDEPNN